MNLTKGKVQYYTSLATLHEAGVPVLKALRHRHAPPFARLGEELAAAIETRGCALSELLPEHPEVFSPLEVRLTRVGERTGRLPAIYRSLAEWFGFMLELRGRLVSGLVYPLFLYHFAGLILPAIGLLTGRASGALTLLKMGLWAAAPYVLTALGLAAGRSLNASGALDRLWLALPFVNRLVRKLNYARFFHAYSLAVEAGIAVPEAARLAAGVCPNQALRGQLEEVAAEVESARCSFTEAFRRIMPAFDSNSMAGQLIDTGEETGRADDMARHIAKVYRAESFQALDLIAHLLPKVIYVIIMLAIAWQIIGFWTNLYSPAFEE
ncbi:MAG: Type II secretion system protein F [Lentisphaerae bacterium ADurb.BinA184]|nr:MAG: Type II secretion system protein F [Lentisphaerae bacterium ADurb.BinA184]